MEKRFIGTDETNDEQASTDRLRRFAELRGTAALQVTELNRLAHKQPQHTRLNVEGFDVVEPVPAEVSMVLAQVAVDR